MALHTLSDLEAGAGGQTASADLLEHVLLTTAPWSRSVALSILERLLALSPRLPDGRAGRALARALHTASTWRDYKACEAALALWEGAGRQLAPHLLLKAAHCAARACEARAVLEHIDQCYREGGTVDRSDVRTMALPLVYVNGRVKEQVSVYVEECKPVSPPALALIIMVLGRARSFAEALNAARMLAPHATQLDPADVAADEPQAHGAGCAPGDDSHEGALMVCNTLMEVAAMGGGERAISMAEAENELRARGVSGNSQTEAWRAYGSAPPMPYPHAGAAPCVLSSSLDGQRR